MSTLNPNERLIRILQATPEQQAAIDRVLDGSAERASNQSSVNSGQGQEASGGAVAVEPFITKAEAAKRLNRDLRTITTWMRKGLVPYYKIAHTVVFKWSEVEKQLAATCRVGRPRY